MLRKLTRQCRFHQITLKILNYRLLLSRSVMGLGAISPDRFDADLMNVVESNAVELASFTAASFTLDANFDGDDCRVTYTLIS